MYRTIPEDRGNLKARFWARYAMGASFATIVGVIGYIVVEVLVGSGWTKTAWVLAFLPTLAVISGTFMLQGVNTVLDTTSGTNCMAMVGAAIREQKKVCSKHNPVVSEKKTTSK
ncbi:MAG: hypothetical protein P4L69_15665 [Desulfosporosinus sp.]|nr:hypothetical protein [Desulfosporosinus sp.]